MQPLTAPPRDGFSADQVRAALVADDQRWGYGVELLAPDLSLVEDISADVTECTVSRDCTATVHGSIDLTLSRELVWGYDRLRPFLLLSSNAARVSGVRFNLGVYIPQTPQADLSTDPVSWQATGQDQLWLLQSYLADSFAVAAGDDVLATVKTLIGQAAPDVPVLLDSTAAGKTYPAGGKTWPLVSIDDTTSGGQFLRIDPVNDLLSTVGYMGLWVDWDGAFRSGPISTAGSEWDFTVGDLRFGIVAADRQTSWDVWAGYNQWPFYMNGLSGQPVDGVSKYTVDNATVGPSSQQAIGVRTAAPQGLDASDYASLVAQGDAIAQAAIRGTRTVTMNTSKLPVAWHRDAATLTDAPLTGAGSWSLLGQKWSLPLHNTDDQAITWQVVA